MTKFIVENKDKIMFKDLGRPERLLIMEAKMSKPNDVGILRKDCTWGTVTRKSIHFDSIYRLKEASLKPSEIDWAQFPAWANYCITGKCGKSYIFDINAGEMLSSIESRVDAVTSFYTSGVKWAEISDFPGFKKGELTGIESILYKNESEKNG